MVGKYINANALKHMYMVEEVTKLPTDLKESMILSGRRGYIESHVFSKFMKLTDEGAAVCVSCC